jgi:hypothetical protein
MQDYCISYQFNVVAKMNNLLIDVLHPAPNHSNALTEQTRNKGFSTPYLFIILEMGYIANVW